MLYQVVVRLLPPLLKELLAVAHLDPPLDRERFAVKRRIQMRDGEKFFQEGRKQANYDLVQHQMRCATTWRLGLRKSALRQFRTLGRDLRLVQPDEMSGGWPGGG